MTEEYNIQYLDLKNKLSLMKVRLLYSANLNESLKEMYGYIDRLLKELDDRYSDEKPLDELEVKIENIQF